MGPAQATQRTTAAKQARSFRVRVLRLAAFMHGVQNIYTH